MSNELRTGPFPHYLVERFQNWRRAKWEDSRAWYARLMEDGQRPRAMLISCCDSRLDTVSMFGAEPGDLFVVRNVANLVPKHSPDHGHHGTSAAVEYAVKSLRVAHIVVVGHSSCGGVKACHDIMCGDDHGEAPSTSYVEHWMEILKPGFNRIKGLHDNKADAMKELEHEAVRTSIRNLQSFPFVTEALDSGMLTLHGAWIDIGGANMHALDGATGKFNKI
jgi:carbonic anhydrase